MTPFPRLLAAALVLAAFPAAASATPPGDNGDLFLEAKESMRQFRVAATGPMAPGALWIDEGRVALRSSPDGSHMAYISADAGRIGISEADGDGERLLSGTGQVDGLTWSPDGERVAFTRDDRLWTVPADGSAAPAQLGGTFVGADGLDWAGESIVVSAAGAGAKRDLYVVDPATGDGAPLTSTATVDEVEPSLAPDGSAVAYVVRTDATRRLSASKLDGTEHRVLVDDDFGLRSPAWAPDGSRIAFLTSSPHGTESVASVTPLGADRKAHTEDTGDELTWTVQPGTGNLPPHAAFDVAPAQPFAGGETVLTSTSTDADGTLAAQEWDLDGDGAYDDASGATATVRFPAAGEVRVGLRVRDNRGGADRASRSVVVLAAGVPGAAFTVEPAAPVLNKPVTFRAAANADPAAQAVKHEWDFDGDGTWDRDTAASRETAFTYTRVGAMTAKLRVTDADGDTAVGSLSFDVTDEVRCGREEVGMLVLDGCLVVDGPRRVARDGVTINGVTFGGRIAIDTQHGNAFAVPESMVADFREGRVGGVPAEATPEVPVSICGERLGTSRPQLRGFLDRGAELEVGLTRADGLRFAGLEPRSNDPLEFHAGTAHLDVDGMFPRLLLNWGAQAWGRYDAHPDCAQRKLTAVAGTLLGQVIRGTEIRLERTGDDRWDGTAQVGYASVPLLPRAQGKVVVVGGRLRALSASFENVDLAPGVRMQKAELGLYLDRGREEVRAMTTIDTHPKVMGLTLGRVKGMARIGAEGVHAEGVLSLMDFEVGYGHFDLWADGRLDVGAEAVAELGPAYAKAEVNGYLDPKRGQFEIVGSGSAGIEGIGKIGVDMLLSNRGIAACGKLSLSPFGSVEPGFSYRWGANWPTVFVDSCDFGAVRVARAASAMAAAAGSRSVAVAGGQRAAVLVARGAPGAPPVVEVRGPRGERVVSRRDGKALKRGRFLVVPNKADGTTNVLVMKPSAGTWRVRAMQRSLRSLGVANALPAVRVRAKRAGKKLTWTLRPIAGQTVRFVEEDAAGRPRAIVSTRKARGSVRWTPRKGAKRVVAQVVQGGLLRESVTVVKLAKR